MKTGGSSAARRTPPVAPNPAADRTPSAAGAKPSAPHTTRPLEVEPITISHPPSPAGAAADDRPAAPSDVIDALEARIHPIASRLGRLAREPGSAAQRLAQALDVLFGADAVADDALSGLLLHGWLRARQDKESRLRMAWLREQLRISLQDILAEAAVRGETRSGLDTAAAAAAIVGAAESCLLQASTEGDAVAPADLARALLTLTLRGA